MTLTPPEVTLVKYDDEEFWIRCCGHYLQLHYGFTKACPWCGRHWDLQIQATCTRINPAPAPVEAREAG